MIKPGRLGELSKDKIKVNKTQIKTPDLTVGEASLLGLGAFGILGWRTVWRLRPAVCSRVAAGVCSPASAAVCSPPQEGVDNPPAAGDNL